MLPVARGAAGGARPSRHLHAGRDHARRCCAKAAAAGARSATIYAAGFGEGGDDEGRRRAARLCATLSRETGLTVVGPNCMGVACGRSRVRDHSGRDAAGARARARSRWSRRAARCAPRSIAPSTSSVSRSRYLVSCGNQIGCTVGDFIDYFADAAGAARHPLLRRVGSPTRSVSSTPRGARARTARRSSRSRSAARMRRAPRRWRIRARSRAAPRCSTRSPRRPAIVRARFARRCDRGGRIPGALRRCRAAAISR